MSRLADRYATALFAAAVEAQATDTVERELVGLAEVFADDAVRRVLAEPDVPRDVVEKSLAKLGEGRHQLIRNLFGVLAERRRVMVLPEIPEAFRALARAARGELTGVVESSHELDCVGHGEARRIAKELSGGQTVELSFKVVPELLGGVRLRIGNTLYDGSLKTQLEDLQDRLLSAPLD